MPALGEVKLAQELGYKGTGKKIWHACIGCGKQRWVAFIKEKPMLLYCKNCPNRIRIRRKGYSCCYVPKTTKVCRRCGKEYPATVEFFIPRNFTKSGLGARCRLCHRKERTENLKVRLSSNIANKINQTLRYGKNGHHWQSLVGFTIQDLIRHLEKQFTGGMGWGNYGVFGWHIDHKIPIAAFNFESPEDIDFRRCWSLRNLQPLWALDNEIKGASISGSFQLGLGIIANKKTVALPPIKSTKQKRQSREWQLRDDRLFLDHSPSRLSDYIRDTYKHSFPRA